MNFCLLLVLSLNFCSADTLRLRNRFKRTDHENVQQKFVKQVDIPLTFRKAGRVWCGGARETH